MASFDAASNILSPMASYDAASNNLAGSTGGGGGAEVSEVHPEHRPLYQLRGRQRSRQRLAEFSDIRLRAGPRLQPRPRCRRRRRCCGAELSV
jgi:hypothetical protein